MRSLSEHSAIQEVAKALAELLGEEAQGVVSSVTESRSSEDFDADIRLSGFLFFVNWLGEPKLSQLGRVAERLSGRTAPTSQVSLIATKYLNPAGRELLAEADVNWLDLSGNAHIRAKGLYVHVEGKPNQFKSPGRPSSPFAPKAARVARYLLVNYPKHATQRDIAADTSMGEGYISRIVKRLDGLGHIERGEEGLRARRPPLLLDDWAQEYKFDKHAILEGYVSARSGPDLAAKLQVALTESGVRSALTGLGAAWVLTRFASFHLVTYFVDRDLSEEELEAIGFRQEPRGANVWLVRPNDDGVFYRAASRSDFQIVHPVQIFLDLHGQPERAKEAAEKMRADFLQMEDGWSSAGHFSWDLDEE